MRDISDSNSDQIAGSELAVDREIKQREVTGAPVQLEPNPDGPDISQFQWWLLANQLAFVPGRPCCGLVFG